MGSRQTVTEPTCKEVFFFLEEFPFVRYEKRGWTVGSPLLISLGVGHIPRMYMVFDSLYMEIHAWSMPWSWLYHYTIKPHVAFRQRSIREGSASG